MFANVTDDGESSGINFNVAATAALKTSFNVARASERKSRRRQRHYLVGTIIYM
jgi:hypothetical protein